MEIEKLALIVNDLSNDVQELRIMRDVSVLQGKINTIRHLEQQVEALTQGLSYLEDLMKAFNTDDRFIECFGQQELKALYAKSGLTLPEVANYITKLIDKECDNAYALEVLAGKGNIRVISRVGKWLRSKAVQNGNKVPA